jgi:hypothetical protein
MLFLKLLCPSTVLAEGEGEEKGGGNGRKRPGLSEKDPHQTAR